MTWTSLTQTLILLVLTLSVVVMTYWPRDSDGRLWTIDEVNKFLDEFTARQTPYQPPTPRRLLMWIGVSLGVTGISFALGR